MRRGIGGGLLLRGGGRSRKEEEELLDVSGVASSVESESSLKAGSGNRARMEVGSLEK
jgi:hypothetical protein